MSIDQPLTSKADLGAAGNRAEGDVDLKVRDRFFPNKRDGVFLEVGAARPDFLSISNLYRRLGWQVLSIEPNPAYAEHYEKYGLERLPYAVDNRDEDDVDFTVVDSHSASYKGGAVSHESWSALAIKDEYGDLKPDLDTKNIKVKVRRLDTIMKDHAPKVEEIDLISADIEGWELEALSSLDFNRYKPKVLIIENLFFDQKYRDFMATRGYKLWRCIPPNDIFAQSAMLKRSERVIGALANGVITAVGRARRRVGDLTRKWRRQA